MWMDGPRKCNITSMCVKKSLYIDSIMPGKSWILTFFLPFSISLSFSLLVSLYNGTQAIKKRTVFVLSLYETWNTSLSLPIALSSSLTHPPISPPSPPHTLFSLSLSFVLHAVISGFLLCRCLRGESARRSKFLFLCALWMSSMYVCVGREECRGKGMDRRER